VRCLKWCALSQFHYILLFKNTLKRPRHDPFSSTSYLRLSSYKFETCAYTPRANLQACRNNSVVYWIVQIMHVVALDRKIKTDLIISHRAYNRTVFRFSDTIYDWTYLNALRTVQIKRKIKRIAYYNIVLSLVFPSHTVHTRVHYNNIICIIHKDLLYAYIIMVYCNRIVASRGR